MYKLYLFWVYLRSKALALIAMGVVALCVFMMLISVSVMSGFLWKVERAARGLFGDIVIESHGQAGLGSYDELIAELPGKVPEVQAATPFILSYGILRVPNTDYRQTVQIAGIRLPERADVSDFENGLFVQEADPKPTFDVPLAQIERAAGADDEFVANLLRREQKKILGIVVDRGALEAADARQFDRLMEPARQVTQADLNFIGALPHRNEKTLPPSDATTLSESRDLMLRAQSTYVFRMNRDRLIAYTKLLQPKIDPLRKALAKAKKDGPSPATVEHLAAATDLLEKTAANATDILAGPPHAAKRMLPSIRAALETAREDGPSRETVEALEDCVTRLSDFVVDPPAYRVILGIGIQGLSYRTDEGETIRHLGPGNKISLLLLPLGRRLGAGLVPEPSLADFTVVDDSRSDVSSIDSRIVYVPFGTLQKMSNLGPEYSAENPTVMLEPARCSQVHIKVKAGIDNEADMRAVAAKIRDFYQEFATRHMVGTTKVEVLTWRQQQAQVIGPLQQQRTLVYIIFIIMSGVCVAIIFALMFVIVRAKTRDIGVIKAVGGSGLGVARIFLAYGAVIGLVGSALGTLGGWWVVRKINPIQDWVDKAFGFRVWNKQTFMFEHIPDEVDWTAAAWIAIGAVVMGIVGAMIPAILGARMDPVEALRYE